MEKDGSRSEGDIKLKLQLVWSKKSYYLRKVKDCEEHLKNIEIESQRLNTLMDTIQNESFGVLFQPEIDEILNERVFIKEYDISNLSKKPVIVKSKRKTLVTQLEHMVRGAFSKYTTKTFL